MNLEKEAVVAAPKSSNAMLTSIEKVLVENGLDANDIERVKRAKFSSWGPEGDQQTATSIVVNFDPETFEGPEWPVVQPSAPTVINYIDKKPNGGLKTAFIFSDVQVGFRFVNGKLDPFHDDRALSVALQLCRDVNPDVVIIIGDFLDLPQFGTFNQEAGFFGTVQPAVDRGHEILAQINAVSPNAKTRIYLEGNHDRRLQNYIERNALAAFGLKQANSTPESWPVMSVPYLLRLDELGYEYVGAYPAGEYYINDNLRVEHGSTVGPRGKATPKMVSDERVTVITGHTHRVEATYKTTDTRDGARVNAAFTIGCLSHITGRVPSTKSAINPNGVPARKIEDWQQAVGVVHFEEGDGLFEPRIVLIHDGKAVFDGQVYEAE